MKIKEMFNTNRIYTQCENEIREWIEKKYPGLSIDFSPHIEIVQIDPKRFFKSSRVKKITEVVNIKIGDIMEDHAEEIYISERLDRIYINHPDFNIEVKDIAELKKHPLFLQFLSELIIRS